MWSEDPSNPIKLDHAKGEGAGVSPEAAGIDITKDGTKLVVANYDEESSGTAAGNCLKQSGNYDCDEAVNK